MEAKAPDKLYVDTDDYLTDSVLYGFTEKRKEDDIEYIRTDAFIEKALKWYCLDCECNDNCHADGKCFFKETYRDYLEGNNKAIPPKIGNAINPEGSEKENYRYRHFIRKLKDAFIEKACKFLFENYHGEKLSLRMIDDFRKHMKG